MNMILHGIEAPSIRHINTLTENVMDTPLMATNGMPSI